MTACSFALHLNGAASVEGKPLGDGAVTLKIREAGHEVVVFIDRAYVVRFCEQLDTAAFNLRGTVMSATPSINQEESTNAR